MSKTYDLTKKDIKNDKNEKEAIAVYY